MSASHGRQLRTVQEKKKTKDDCRLNQESRDIRQPPSQPIPLRLVKPCLLIYEESGRLVHEVSAREDRQALRLGCQERLLLIQYVQKLRLMIWLLRKQSLWALAANKEQRSLPSSLGLQAGLASSLATGCCLWADDDCTHGKCSRDGSDDTVGE